MNENRYAAPRSAVADVAGASDTGRPLVRPAQIVVAAVLMTVAMLVRIFFLLDEGRSLPLGISRGTLYVAVALSLALNTLLIVKVFQGRNWARIVYLVLFCLSLPSLIKDGPALYAALTRAEVAITAVQAMGHLLALALVFLPPGRAWFRREAGSLVRRLFSYGSLREAEVQRALFGRALDGRGDAIVGFELAQSRSGEHLNVVRSAQPGVTVGGMVFEVSDEELERADAHERKDGYERIEVTLASGAHCWVYVEAQAAA